jgi:hypothetical protein
MKNLYSPIILKSLSEYSDIVQNTYIAIYPKLNKLYLKSGSTEYTIASEEFINSNYVSGSTDDFYTKTESDNNFLSGTTKVDQIGGYTTTESDNNFLSANTSFYTQSEVDNNFLSANTSFYTQSEVDNNFLSATTTVDQIGGYNTTQSDNKFIYVTGDTMTGTLIVNSDITGQTLNATQKINLSIYSNTSVEGDLWYSGENLYFTSGSTDIDLLDKLEKVTGYTSGNIPMFTSDGQLTDSGIEATQEYFDLIDFITLSATTEDTNTVIPANYRITSIVFEELSGNSAGDLYIGTTTGFTGDVVSGETVNSNELIDATLGTNLLYSTTESKILYVESTSWGSSSVNVYIRIEKFNEG